MVSVEMDKTRNIKFGMRAVDVIEQSFQKPISKIDFDSLTMRETATVIMAGLVHEDKELTEDKVMDIIDENDCLNEVLEALSKAMQDMEGKNSKNNKALKTKK